MILVCGASGLVGKEMCNLLDEKNVNYIGTYNTNKKRRITRAIIRSKRRSITRKRISQSIRNKY